LLTTGRERRYLSGPPLHLPYISLYLATSPHISLHHLAHDGRERRGVLLTHLARVKVGVRVGVRVRVRVRVRVKVRVRGGVGVELDFFSLTSTPSTPG
jgi:hypothetical protein